MKIRGAGAVVVLCLVALSTATGSDSSAALGLLALGATETHLRDGEGGALAAVALAAAAVVAVTVLSDIHDAVAVGALVGVAAGEVTARPVRRGGEGIVDSASAPVYILSSGFAGAGGAFVVGAEPATSVTVGFFASLAAGTARAMQVSVRTTVIVAAVGAATGSAVGTASSAVVLVAAGVVIVALAGAANLTDVMTVSGASAGAFLSYVVFVAGGVGWLFVLGVFVVVGASTTAYGREEKTQMGLAEHTEGRGFENVAANGVVALGSAVVYATASGATLGTAAAFAFVGCMATATADTASSEIGTVAGEPRLVTTFERVPPGTDGGVSWQGEVVTVVAVGLIGAAAYAAGVLPAAGAVAAGFAGLVGAHVDSLLGATVEGRYLGNSGVNLSACTAGAVIAAAFVLF